MKARKLTMTADMKLKAAVAAMLLAAALIYRLVA